MSIACLNGCGKVGLNRGLCAGCKTTLQCQVREGKTTWAKLQAEGRANAPRKNLFGRGNYPKKAT